MGDQWYYAQDGRRSGPIRLDELRDLAGSGRLQPYDLVRDGKSGSWKPARQVEGLTFPPGPASPKAKPTAPPPAPAGPLRPEWAWLEREAVPDLQAPGFLHSEPGAEPEEVPR